MTPPFPSDGAQGLTPEGTVLSPFLVQGGGGPPQARVGSPAAAVGLCLGQQIAEGVKELFQPRLIPHALLDHLLLAQVLRAALDGQGLQGIKRRSGVGGGWGSRDQCLREKGAGSWTSGSEGRRVGDLDCQGPASSL